jgi:polyisoprenoid-binding protein YceI
MTYQWIPLFTALLFFFSYQSNAQCIDLDNMSITWTAFKTMKKTPVTGSFTAFEVEQLTPAKDFKSQISSLKITIDPLKISTNNPIRDGNIAQYFFAYIGKIHLKTLRVNKKWIKMSIRMKGKKKTIPFRFTRNEANSSITAIANIDILDFGLSKELSQLNKQCFSMHEGKTWSHVETKVSAKIIKCVK